MRGVRELGLMFGLLVVFLVVPSIWGFVYFSRTLGVVGIAMALAGFVVAYLWRRSDFVGIVDEIRDSGQWLKGAKGEYRVHKELALLTDEFIIFHDFHPRGSDGKPVRWNVDHIIVGPSGVFVLDAKNYGRARVPDAAASAHSKKNVHQTRRNAVDLKGLLKKWSRDELEGVFVVPVVVYTQENAHVDQLREGPVRVLPLRLLVGDVARHTESAIDLERCGRLARALFGQLPVERQMPFRSEIDAYLRLTSADRSVGPSELATPAAVEIGIPDKCPLCGGQLVRKLAKRGERAGKPFLGCANYSKTGCKYGFNLG